ncbi:MAG TPA: hypothetical protein VEN47_08635 [Myxococcota bacterium]|nr:hypothetical protein [Myxococcota bacterium]
MRSIIAHGIALALAATLAGSAAAEDEGHTMWGPGGMGGMGGQEPNMPSMGHEKPAPRLLLAFGTMAGVDGPFVGDANPIRNVVGDESPWTVSKSARGFLTTSGHLVIHVRGLVFPNEPGVPADIVGTNDEAQFRGLVSCLTPSADGMSVETMNVTTQGFNATTTGNANIDAQLTLPSSCIAPIVFVLAGSEDKWFAVTGSEPPEPVH